MLNSGHLYCFLSAITLVSGQLFPFQPFQPLQQGGASFQTFQPQQPTTSQATLDLIELNRNMENPQYWRDRREGEGWWGLYPFGEMYYDIELLNQPNLDRQIDLDFYYPFYGFRYNYTYIIPNGILAFSRPEWIQPPWTFPNPKWPERRDASFIAPFFADATYQYVGETGVSHVWYRTVHRPRYEGIQRAPVFGPQFPTQFVGGASFGFPGQQFGQYGVAKRVPGYIEDLALLDNITRDVRDGIIGANGWEADHALIVTWERMAYGGAPKVVEVHRFEEVKKWQNTYQIIIATDEIRSFAMFNYGTINWTASNEAGALTGRGGMQSAMAGMNGGNGTGWSPLPYSGEGEMYKLAQYTSSVVPGRWVYRVDEELIAGGCSNNSIGAMTTSPTETGMLGGMIVNVSGPCFRPGDAVVVIFDEYTVNCRVVDMGRAMCVLPKFHKIGLILAKISRDGGYSYPFQTTFYLIQSERQMPYVTLVRDTAHVENNWDNPWADKLSIGWGATNLTWNQTSRINIDLMGFWEDTERSSWERVGVIAENIVNTGEYEFQPRLLTKTDTSLRNMWKWYTFGSIRISVAGDPGQGIHLSPFAPFVWYFRPEWEYYYGSNWAIDICIEWFEYDGNRQNFIMDLEPCPCILDQALLDGGRFMPHWQCDMEGDSSCKHHRGSQHCVMSVQPSWTGAQQVCCYDFEGWLMMSDDYETPDHLKYYSPGAPYRSHMMGAYPYKMPPWIPSASNWMNDLMPYEMCCKHAQHCEFYFWRRQTNGCQDYRAPIAGYAYGEPHFITFDGVQYTFNGRGYYVLAMSDHPLNKLMVQVRMEQPPKTLWNTYPNATVITGVAIQENDSDVVEIVARKEFRRWRYKMDVRISGNQRFTDSPEMKWQKFKGVSFFSPAQNMDYSILYVQLQSGAGVRVAESNGVLDIMVIMPPSYNETYKHPFRWRAERDRGSVNDYYRTYGLLGTYNNDPVDDFMLPDGSIPIHIPSTIAHTDAESRAIYYQFGEKWKVDGNNPFIGGLLFSETTRPIYNPLLFASPGFTPEFDTRYIAPNASLLFGMREIVDACQGNWACRYDYVLTGVREIALSTLSQENAFLAIKAKGQKQLVSCGALLKAYGAVKTPIGNNYLDGVTVTFTCRPEYFLHGDQQRSCVNGTWTPGWHVWCRTRIEENALKWFCAIIVSLLILGMFTFIFCYCYYAHVRPHKLKMEVIMKGRQSGYQPQYRQKFPPQQQQQQHGQPLVSQATSYQRNLAIAHEDAMMMPSETSLLSRITETKASSLMTLEEEPGPARNAQLPPMRHVAGSRPSGSIMTLEEEPRPAKVGLHRRSAQPGGFHETSA